MDQLKTLFQNLDVLILVAMTQWVGIARDLIMFEKNSSGKVNGVPENLQPCVLTAYKEFKNNPSKLDEYEKLDRTIRST